MDKKKGISQLSLMRQFGRDRKKPKYKITIYGFDGLDEAMEYSAELQADSVHVVVEPDGRNQ